ncbi:unnamed protein product, partial [Coregonus sp. 'balchen']
MFNWVVKVVPQPPDAPGSLGQETANPQKVSKDEVRKEVNAKPTKQKEEDNSEDNGIQSQSGVMTWLSNGFTSALPQPTGTPNLSRSNSVSRWIAEGLSKVVPQPDDKYREDIREEEEEVT